MTVDEAERLLAPHIVRHLVEADERAANSRRRTFHEGRERGRAEGMAEALAYVNQAEGGGWVGFQPFLARASRIAAGQEEEP